MRISIITTSLNSAPFLSYCLESVARQDKQGEHIIVDGASTDNTLDIVREINPRARIFSEPDQGPYDAMNKGILTASGDIIGILNADDFYPDPEVLETVARTMERTGADSCYGDLEYVARDDPERVVRRWKAGPYDRKNWYRGWMPPHPAFFVRKNVYDRFGLYRLDMGTAADYELMLRFLLKHGISTVYIPRVLVKMRTGGLSNVSIRNRIRANLMDRKAWKVNGLKPKPWTMFLKPLRKIRQWF